MPFRTVILWLCLGVKAFAQLPDQQIQNCLTEAQRYYEAKNEAYGEAHCQQATNLAEKVYGKNDARLVPMLEQVFKIQENARDYPKAELLRLRILALVRRGRHPSDPVIAHERVRLANFYATQSRFADCNAQFEQAMAALAKDPFNKASELPHVMDQYAAALLLQGREADARELTARAVRYRARQF